MKACTLIAIFIILQLPLFAETSVKNDEVHFVPGKEIGFVEDPEGTFTIDSLLQRKNFSIVDQQIPNFGQTRSTFWLKFELTNLQDENIYIEIGNPLLNEIDVYAISPDRRIVKTTCGNHYSFFERALPVNTFLIDPEMKKGMHKTIFVRLRSVEPLEAPINVGTLKAFYAFDHKLNFLEGIYFGFIILIFLYNLFLYFSTKDDLYLYYVIYVFSMIIMMAHFKGYTFEYLWPNHYDVNKYFAVIYSFGCSAGIVFSIKFLKSKFYTPVLYKLSFVFIFLFAIAIAISFFGYYFEANVMEMSVGMAGCMYLFILGITTYVKGNKAAKYYIYAFSCIIIGAIVTTFYYLTILPYNIFNSNAVLAGSGMELMFLSFALADKINRYKADTEHAQREMIHQLKENEKLKDEMNRELEKMVKERTQELNEKSAQVDLLIYKASHDIKGPLRSVITLTKLGMNDLKENAQALTYLENIHAASSKVSHMVTDMLNLAKIKETSLTYEEVNIEEMVQEILTSLQHLPEYSRIHFQFGIQKNISLYTDRKAFFSILQNLLENGIKYSDKEKPSSHVKITINKGAKNYLIVCEDNGIGIPSSQKDKIFDMFYKVNEESIGSGMGLFLVKETVKKLGGEIELTSEEGMGSSFVISLPIKPHIELPKQTGL